MKKTRAELEAEQIRKLSPLWCKRGDAGASGNSENNKTGEHMDKQETVAELQARNATLEQKVAELKAKNDAVSQADLRAAQAELREIQASIKLAEAEEKNKALEAAESGRKEKEAEAAVARMVAGKGAVAIGPRETELQAEWKRRFIADPSLIPVMAGDATPAGRVVKPIGPDGAKNGNGFEMISDVTGALRTMGSLCAKNTNDQSIQNKFKAAFDIGAIYAKELRPIFANAWQRGRGVPTFDLQAAAAADTLGTLAGTLVTQRTLDLYKFEFPMLDEITTDFSDQPAHFNQTTTTRIIVVPAVLSYDATIGSDGRPNGYVIATPAQTTDASVTLNYHRAVSIMFDANALGATQRRLFEEMGPASAYALGKDVVDALYAVITSANFTTNTPIPVAAINFGRPTFAKAKKVLNKLGVPFTNRFALINSDYYETLEQDQTLSQLAVFQKPEIITDSALPFISKFRPIEAPNLPATAFGAKTLQAFFAHKSSLLMQARVPNDWTTVLGPGDSYGTINVVTNPDTGLSVLLVQYSNPRSAYAEYRLALFYGVAKGNEKGGQPVTD